MSTLKASFRDCTSDLTVRHGWGLDGPGPARFGWWAVHPHRIQWLGRTRADVVERMLWWWRHELPCLAGEVAS